MRDIGLRRHDLVHVDPAAWARVLAGRPEFRAIEVVSGWAEAGHPLVARRRTENDPEGRVALGLPLPPNLGKRRIAVTVEPADILRVSRCPALRAAAGFAPATWHPTLEELLRLAATVGIEPLVFGSLAWAALTRLDYLGPTSDLDLLWRLGLNQDASGLLDGLRRIALDAPMRLDGEVIDPEDRGANWRELASGNAEVLVKGLTAVELIPARCFVRARVAA